MLEDAGICAETCGDMEAEAPFSTGSGGAVIFGATGGVTEAVLRYLSPKLGFDTIEWIYDCGVRGGEYIKTISLPLPDRMLRIAVVSGHLQAKKTSD